MIVPVNLNDCDYSETELERIVKVLGKNNWFSDNFLFTVIDGKRIPEFLKKGTYRKDNVIYAFLSRDLSEEYVDGFSINKMIDYYGAPAIAVYKASHFLDNHNSFEYEFKFVNPDKKPNAVAGVLELKF